MKLLIALALVACAALPLDCPHDACPAAIGDADSPKAYDPADHEGIPEEAYDPPAEAYVPEYEYEVPIREDNPDSPQGTGPSSVDYEDTPEETTNEAPDETPDDTPEESVTAPPQAPPTPKVPAKTPHRGKSPPHHVRFVVRGNKRVPRQRKQN